MTKRKTTNDSAKAQPPIGTALEARPAVLMFPPGTKLEYHPFSMEFPMMGEEEFAAFKENIKKVGQINPSTMFQDQILEGRNRDRATFELKIGLKYEVFIGTEDEAREFVFSNNMTRRNLTPGQKALIAANKVTSKKGDNRFSISKMTQAQAAKKCGVSVDSIKQAARLKDAPKEIYEAVWTGKMALNAAIDKAFPKEGGAKEVPLAVAPDEIVTGDLADFVPLSVTAAGRQQIVEALGKMESLKDDQIQEAFRKIMMTIGRAETPKKLTPMRGVAKEQPEPDAQLEYWGGAVERAAMKWTENLERLLIYKDGIDPDVRRTAAKVFGAAGQSLLLFSEEFAEGLPEKDED